VENILELLVIGVLLTYIFATFDDIVFDILYAFNRHKIKADSLAISVIEMDKPKRIAIMIPAWQEAGVVAPMIRSTIGLTNYPRLKLDFFVGVYPNDIATLEEVRALSKVYPNVHCVVNYAEGPTNKSQNLNYIYSQIEQLELKRGVDFELIAVHDAEDVIHPYTFRLYSALMNRHGFVQLPVFALFPKGNFFKRAVASTYADEFAEHHLHHIPIREHLGLFVPSAGTGFAIRREIMSELAADGPVFNEKSLTEDYELALRLWEKGHRVHFHIQRLWRMDSTGKLRKEIVAVREHFPNKLKDAVKQKGRWTYGIALQVPQLFNAKNLSLKERFTLWRDQKSKSTNLIHLLGYPVAAYALWAQLFGGYTFSPWVMLPLIIVLAITLERLLMRFRAVKEIYGLGEALLTVLVLPGLPLRWLVANVINTLATLRAWRVLYRTKLAPAAIPVVLDPFKTQSDLIKHSPTPKPKQVAVPRWDKTQRNSYVAPEILEAARRRLGDQLLFYNEITPQDLAKAIAVQAGEINRRPLGEILLEKNLIGEEKLRKHLVEIRNFVP
jgi:bacteriophage N4 adsorption protein B